MFRSDVQALDRDYHIRRAEENPGVTTLHLTPRDKASPIQEIALRFRELQSIEMGQVNHSGDRVVLKVQKFLVNPEALNSPALLAGHSSTG